MDGANIVVVRSNSRNGVGDGSLADVVVQHSRTEDLKRVNRVGVNRESIGLAADQSDGGVGLVSVDGIEETREVTVKSAANTACENRSETIIAAAVLARRLRLEQEQTEITEK